MTKELQDLLASAKEQVNEDQTSDMDELDDFTRGYDEGYLAAIQYVVKISNSSDSKQDLEPSEE